MYLDACSNHIQCYSTFMYVHTCTCILVSITCMVLLYVIYVMLMGCGICYAFASSKVNQCGYSLPVMGYIKSVVIFCIFVCIRSASIEHCIGLPFTKNLVWSYHIPFRVPCIDVHFFPLSFQVEGNYPRLLSSIIQSTGEMCLAFLYQQYHSLLDQCCSDPGCIDVGTVVGGVLNFSI